MRAFEAGERFAQPFADAHTSPAAFACRAAVGDFMILDAIRASGGRAVAVDEARLRYWMALATSSEGISVCPETAACVGAVEQLAREGWIAREERVVIFNTGAAQKYPEAMAIPLPRLDKDAPLDWEMIERG